MKKVILFFTIILNIAYCTEYNINNYIYNTKTNIEHLPDLIGFDLCGTIINSKSSDIHAINLTIKKFLGNNLSWEDIKSKKDPLLSMKQNFPNFFGDKYIEAYNFYLKTMFKDITNLEVFEGIFDVLEFCKIHNIKIVLITNRDKEYLLELKNNNKYGKKILSMFDIVLTADETGLTKPNPLLLKKAIDIVSTETKINKIFFVGDALADANLVRNNFIDGYFVLMAKTTSDINNNNINFLFKDKKSYIFTSYNDLLNSFKKIVK